MVAILDFRSEVFLPFLMYKSPRCFLPSFKSIGLSVQEDISYIIIRFLINMQVQGQHPHQWAPFQIAGLLHAWQISHQISRYVYMRIDSRELPFSVSCFHVILGLPGPCFPSTCMSKAVLVAPLERSTCPYHWSLLLQNEVQILNAKHHK